MCALSVGDGKEKILEKKSRMAFLFFSAECVTGLHPYNFMKAKEQGL